MKKTDLLIQLDRMLDLPDGSLKGPEALASLEQWDSLATVSFLALADRSFGMTISPGDVANSETINDLTKLLGDKID